MALVAEGSRAMEGFGGVECPVRINHDQRPTSQKLSRIITGSFRDSIRPSITSPHSQTLLTRDTSTRSIQSSLSNK